MNIKRLLESIIDKESLNLEEIKCIREYVYPEEQLDFGEENSSLKKNLSLINRLKSINKNDLENIGRDIIKYRSEKFIDEMISSLMENRLMREGDTQSFVRICIVLHLKYEKFSYQLFPRIQSYISIGKEESEVYRKLSIIENFVFIDSHDNRGKVISVRNKIKYISCVVELLMFGVFYQGSFIVNFISDCVKFDMRKLVNYPIYLNLISHTLKTYSNILIDSVQTNMNDISLYMSGILGINEKKRLRDIILEYVEFLKSFILHYHENVFKKLEREQNEYYNTQGDLDIQEKKKYNVIYEKFKIFDKNLSDLCELFNVEYNSIEDDHCSQEIRLESGLIVTEENSEDRLKDIGSGLYNYEQNDFYKNLPDVGSIKKSERQKLRKYSKSNFPGEFLKIKTKDQSDQLAGKCFCVINQIKSKHLNQVFISTFIANEHLISVYSRFIATVHKVHSYIVGSLVDEIILCIKSNTTKNSSKIALSKVLVEFVKFNVIDPTILFMYMKYLLDNFTGFNINLFHFTFENAGIYLYKNQSFHVRILRIIDVLNGKIKYEHNGRIQAMIDKMVKHVYDYPSEKHSKPDSHLCQKDLLFEYIKYLFGKMKTNGVEFTLDKFLKLPLSNEECLKIIRGLFVKIYSAKEDQIELFAEFLKHLYKVYPNIVGFIIDDLIEEIFVYLEVSCMYINVNYQLYVSIVRFIGFLFLKDLLNTDVILNILYLIVTFGHKNGVPDANTIVSTDLPDNCFRIRMVCCLLNIVLESASFDPLKFRNFIVLFNHYVCTKTRITQDIKFYLLDIIDKLDLHTNLKGIVDRKHADIYVKVIVPQIKYVENKTQNRTFEEEYMDMINTSRCSVSSYKGRPQDVPLPSITSDGGSRYKILIKKKKKSKSQIRDINIPEDHLFISSLEVNMERGYV